MPTRTLRLNGVASEPARSSMDSEKLVLESIIPARSDCNSVPNFFLDASVQLNSCTQLKHSGNSYRQSSLNWNFSKESPHARNLRNIFYCVGRYIHGGSIELAH